MDLINYPSTLIGGQSAIADDYEGRRGAWGVQGESIDRTYSPRLKITTSSKLVGPASVLLALPVRIGDSYRWPLASGLPTEQDTGSFLQGVELEQDSVDGLQWIAQLSYGPYHVPHELGNSLVDRGVINPLERAPVVEWDEAKFERHKTTDNGSPPLPYVNTAGDPLEDPPALEETRPILRIARNEPQYNDAYAKSFKDTTNADVFLGYPANTVKCKTISAERIYSTDWGYYYRVTYQFELRDDADGNGYRELVLNAGYRRKFLGAGNPVDVMISGCKVSSPVPLKKNGDYDPAAAPYYLEFVLFPPSDFSQLNIPDDILFTRQ